MSEHPTRKIKPDLGAATHQDRTTSSQCSVGEDTVTINDRGTYPRLCRLSNGSLLCSFTGTEKQERILCVTRSIDNGETFHPFGLIAGGENDCDNAFLLEVPSAAPYTGQPGPVVLAAFRDHDHEGPDGTYRYFRITIYRSLDGGRSWNFLSQAFETSAKLSRGMGVWEPFMRIGKKGEIQLTYSGELAPDNQEIYRVDSFNGGGSWTLPRCLGCHGPNERLRDGMQGIVSVKEVVSAQEALVMVFETTRRTGQFAGFSVEYVISYDDGVTWGRRGVVYSPPEARVARAPQIEKFANGILAVVFRTDEDSESTAWPRNAAIKAVFSQGLHEGKIEWTKPILVEAEKSHWPGILSVDERKAMAVYEHDGKPIGRILTWAQP